MPSKSKFFSGKKIEYIEAIVYILAIIIAVFANIYGNTYIKMLPILFILGILGKIVFGRPVTTTVFGFIVSICILHIKSTPSIVENVFMSACMVLPIALGELFGEYIIYIYKFSSKPTKNKNKLIYNLFFAAVVFTIFCAAHNFLNGNIIEYNICRRNVEKYVNDNYSDMYIKDFVYSINKSRNYSFNVVNKSNGKINKFTVYLKNKDIVYDEYKEEILAKNNTILNTSFNKFLINNNLINKYNELDIKLEYIEINEIEINITKDVYNITENVKLEFAKEIVAFLDDLKKSDIYMKAEQLVIILKNKNNTKDNITSNIYMDGYNENLINIKFKPYEYILKSLSVEYIDSKN